MDDESVDLDAVVAEIEAVAAQRTGRDYPAELDARLEAHYQRIVERLPRPFDHGRLDDAIARASEAAAIDPRAIDTSSGVPGGGVVHRLAGRAVSRQTNGLAEQLNRFTAAVVDALAVLAEATRHPRSHGHPDLQGAVDVVLDAVAAGTRVVGFAADGDVDLSPVARDLEGRGPAVEVGQAGSIAAVTEAADESFAVINALGALGRLTPRELEVLAEVSSRKLLPGGVLVVGGIEPVTLDAVDRAARISPYALTHPSYVEALLQHHGLVTSVERVGDGGAFAVLATRPG